MKTQQTPNLKLALNYTQKNGIYNTDGRDKNMDLQGMMKVSFKPYLCNLGF